MFGRRTSKAERAQGLAEDAWRTLVSSWESARDATGDLVEGTQERVGSVTDEARRRAAAALDAISGRRPSRPWTLLMAAVAAGVAVGWIAAAAIGRPSELPELTESAGSTHDDVTSPR